MHYFIGDLGHLFVISSFVASLVAAFSYFKATQTLDEENKKAWLWNGRIGFFVHTLSVIGTVVALFVILANHYFEYHYAFNYSDRKLPLHYLISTFWNGQEGSFLLWLFWQALIGIALIFTNRYWEGPILTIFALVQAFLASMILGVVIPGLDIKIGSSPFILLRDAMRDAPIFLTQPDFIPADGNGLNPLLQNYWMVIHPPTLFLGFAATLIPFSFCLAGLWLRKYHEWIRPALPWTLFASAILGLGILMGGYWAYETLNFGGYWNWDPVENAVYVPWLVLIASLHTMITYKNSETALKSAMVLSVATFILILYSTFLTRSGILGESSVHSFTDLGLSGQLLIYLCFFLIVPIAMMAIRWKHIPSSEKEISTYSREFWIFIGAALLCLMGFQVIVETSKPVYNEVARLIGMEGNMAPRPDAILFYSRFQLWFAVFLALLSGVGQFFWWKKIDRQTLSKELLPPSLLTLGIFAIIITVGKVYEIPYILLTLASLFTIIANGKIALGVLKSSPSLSGGGIAHIGVGLMLLGILFSSGYSRVVSLNTSSMLISKEFSDEFNRENLLLFLNEPREMAGYELEYKGERWEPRQGGGYVNKYDVWRTSNDHQVIAKKDIVYLDKKLFSSLDTFDINPENTYYEIAFKKEGKEVYTLFPRVQINERMGGIVASPDIVRKVGQDIYTHVTAPMSEEAKEDWGKETEYAIAQGQDFFPNDYVATLDKVERIFEMPGLTLGPEDVAVKAHIRVKGKTQEYIAHPIFLIKDRMAGRLPDDIQDLGLRLSLLNIHPETSTFTIGVRSRQKDWVVIKAIEKPLINVLWGGTLVLMIGFTLSMVRRFREFNKMKQKGLE